MKNGIFAVDVKGLRQLQEGKPKWFIIRELLQNAMDEDITKCNIYLRFEYGKAHINVEDDSPIGFRDLSDAYTLFKDTYKRSDVKKRGRFNFGEKQVLCLSDFARIITTTGGLEFDVLKGTRTTLRRKRAAGSEVYVVVKMTREEFNECCTYCNDILVPQDMNVLVTINDEEKALEYKKPYKTFSARLLTEVKEEDKMRNVTRETEIHLHKPEVVFKNDETVKVAYIYEMGIPICEIECAYSIDIQQKVPLSNDRDKVDSKYLKTIYGEVLNQVIDDITPEKSSDIWVREGFTSDRAEKETRQDIITKRFGEKALIANPNDKRSMDEAISNNYNVIFGAEMNGEEWKAVKQDNLLVSTSTQFKVGIAEGRMVLKLTDEQKKIAEFSKKIANTFLGIQISVGFYDSPDATVIADFSMELKKLRFNVAHIDEKLWYPVLNTKGMAVVQQPMLDLIIHELGHSEGWHYEQSYHQCITALGSKLTIKALSEPEWFIL